MSTRGEQFQQYLDAREDNSFQPKELKDEMNTIVYHSVFEIKGKDFPLAVIVDDTSYSVIQVLMCREILQGRDQLAAFKAINRWNMRLRPFKYIFDSHGSLVLNCCLLHTSDAVDGDAILAMINTIYSHLENNFPEVLKSITE